MTTERTSPVDPWHMQRTLMAASDQHLPAAPELNKGVLLYQRLNLEEGAETLDGLSKALGRLISAPETAEADKVQLISLLAVIDHARATMHTASLSMRSTLEAMRNDFRAELLPEEIKEIADGCTDLTVTNSGLALSLGIDGAACYDEVAGSNLSKRNPDTGRIDKTPDGKWIKGRNYRAPDLGRVIFGA